jgi:hypothetical protein
MAKNERSFRYQERSKEDVRERANMRGGNFDNIFKPQYKLYKIKDGKNVIRILPPTWEKAKHYGFDIFVNYNIGADKQSYLSISKMKNKPDPLAEARQQAEREGEEELAKALRPTQRILMWVIDRSDEAEGPLLWGAPFTVDKAFANLAFDEDTKEVILIDDPENGCDVRFYKEGTGMTTKYDASKMKLLTAGPLCEDEKLQQDWLEYITENPIPDCLQYYDYEHIAGVYDGKTHSVGDEEAPAKARRAAPDDEDEVKPARRRPAPVDEEADEEAPPRRRAAVVDEDDEPEPAPRRAARGRLKGETDEPPTGESIRDRIRRRHAATTTEDDD